MDIIRHNSLAWDREVLAGNLATIPTASEEIEKARASRGVTMYAVTKALPAAWFEGVADMDVLCLASGGGQQAPLFAAAGARVTLLDNSPLQLRRDEAIAREGGLAIRTVLGDMRDLSDFANDAFDLIFNPISNCYVDDVSPVWRECHRVLRAGGHLVSTFWNPINYMFDMDLAEEGILKLRYSIPYSDLTSLPKARLEQYVEGHEPLEFGHSLAQQIGGQIAAGFAIVGFEEDRFEGEPLSRYLDTVITTRAIKMAQREVDNQ